LCWEQFAVINQHVKMINKDLTNVKG
jgi:hypothetical protein